MVRTVFADMITSNKQFVDLQIVRCKHYKEGSNDITLSLHMQAIANTFPNRLVCFGFHPATNGYMTRRDFSSLDKIVQNSTGLRELTFDAEVLDSKLEHGIEAIVYAFTK